VKLCKTCRELKPQGEFYRHYTNKDGLRTSCKKCHVAAALRWKKENPDKYREQKRRYMSKPEVYEDHLLAIRLSRFRKRQARKRGA
jgi:alkylated DNA repair dioxygenase AlkB